MKQDGMPVPCLQLSIGQGQSLHPRGGNFTLPTEQEETVELHAKGMMMEGKEF